MYNRPDSRAISRLLVEEMWSVQITNATSKDLE